jgi:hypothetical protein
VTKGSFRECAQNCGFISYHGHVEYDGNEVLNSGLILSGSENAASASSEDAQDQSHAEVFTVREIFDLLLDQNAPHFNIIGCESALQNISPGDEPLGLISVLLYAGATSVLGCLWPVESRAGRIVSDQKTEIISSITTKIHLHDGKGVWFRFPKNLYSDAVSHRLFLLTCLTLNSSVQRLSISILAFCVCPSAGHTNLLGYLVNRFVRSLCLCNQFRFSVGLSFAQRFKA